MVEESVQGKLAVAGGGITGLSAAYYALKQGVPGDRIDVYEGSNRLGGKIESATLDGKVVNKGAEFVDTDYHQFIGLCNELGVKLTDATDQQAMTMQRPGGGSMSEARFMREYQPLADIMLQHKAELAAQPYGALARRLDAMSVDSMSTRSVRRCAGTSSSASSTSSPSAPRYRRRSSRC
ncbi:MAG: FAD-dependent oxidoreductase [Alphaproteobacteria bacterium]